MWTRGGTGSRNSCSGRSPRIVLVLVCALFLLPFYWMVVTALKSRQNWSPYPPTLWP